MANEICGDFRDPAGNVMTLRGTSPESFRVLVTRKLESGWTYADASPVVVPLRDEHVVAIPPPYAAIIITREEPVMTVNDAALEKIAVE